ncbi:hypothetical protein J7K93_02405 [bacterium]|nr:hypothetical protein [bacterium]
MKKTALILALLLIITGSCFAQIQAGDKEVSFLGFFSTFVGENIDANGYGSLQISYGKYYTKFFQVGIAPIVSFSTGKDDNGDPKVDVQYSGSIFFNLNMATASKTVPYFTGRYYQYTFDIPEDKNFIDYSYITIGGGVKSFFNEYAAFNTVITYGFSPEKESKGGIIMIMTGLSFIF